MSDISESIKDFKHKIKMKVRFSDLDAMRHVNNATYLTYLEEARISYYKDILDLPKKDIDFGAVVAKIEISYIHPLVLGEEIEVLTRTFKFGRKSSDIENLIVVERKGEKIIAAQAFTKLVSYDYKTLKSIETPADIQNRIKEFEGI
jgi:acyl-CoA thioester hydrolase